PERTRKSSWSVSRWYMAIGSPGSSTVRTTPSCGNTGLAPSRRGHRPSPCPSRQTAPRALRTYHPSPAGRSPCSVCSRGNSGTGIVLPVPPASSIPGLLVPADLVGVDTSEVREIDGQPLEANDVHHRVTRGHKRRLTTELAESTHDVGRPLGSSAGPLEHEAAHRRVDRSEMAVEPLLRVVRLGGDVGPFSKLEDRLEHRRRIGGAADHRESLVLGRAEGVRLELLHDQLCEAGDVFPEQRAADGDG